MMSAADVKVRLDEEGYCIVEGILSDAEVSRYTELSDPHLKRVEDNFLHLGGALNDVPELSGLVLHPLVLEVAEHLLGERFILANNVDVMWSEPGSGAQGLHSDVPLSGMRLPWPPFATAMQAFWMLTDYTPQNGATVIVPFSQHARRPPSRPHYDTEISVLGPRGSVFIMHNALWHRRGANTSEDQKRGTIDIFYKPWFIARPRDAWPLVKRDVFDKLPEALQKMLGPSVED